MRVTTKTDRQKEEYKNHQRNLSRYEREQKPLAKAREDKLSLAERQRMSFLSRKVRALRGQLRID